MPKNKTADRKLSPEEERIRKVIAGWYQASGMTQQTVADRVGLGQTAVSAFLLGKRFGTVDSLQAFCKCFGYGMADLFVEEPRSPMAPEAQRLITAYNGLAIPGQKAAFLALVESLAESQNQGKAREKKRSA